MSVHQPKGPPECERPAPPQDRHTRNNTSAYEFSRDPHEPLTAEDRHEQKVLEEAARLGYRLATRCSRCNQWVVSSKSVAAHMGPVCRAKAKQVVA